MIGPFHASVHREISAAGPAILFRDEFTDPDGTPLDQHTPNIDVIGGGWIVSGTELEINTNRCRADTGFRLNAGVADVSNANVRITARFLRGEQATYRRGICFRTADNDSWLFFGARAGAAELRSDGGAIYWSELSYPWGIDVWHDLKIECNNSNVKAWIDDDIKFNGTITEYQTVTTHGVLLQRRNAYIDDYEITELS